MGRQFGETLYWGNTLMLNFCQEQWKFLVRILGGNSSRIELEPSDILPFTEKTNFGKEGAFGQVFQVQVHPEHFLDQLLDVRLRFLSLIHSQSCSDFFASCGCQDDGARAKLAIKEFISPANNAELQKGVDGVFKTEAQTYDDIRRLRHPHIIQMIAAITRGTQRWLMFPWADGGNLRDFWRETPNELTARLVRSVVEQLRGIAEALMRLHALERGHIRHGDLKPENLLIFRNRGRMGTLKIADMGSAKRHVVATELRPITVGKAYATLGYQPPESVTQLNSSSSRLYDIWSMGCVTLEFLVWLLYGDGDLQQFGASIKGRMREANPFFEVEPDPQGSTPSSLVAHIHPAVQVCLDHMSKDTECSGPTALGDLLDIVQTKLLVVDLPEHTASTMEMPNVTVTDTDNSIHRYRPFGRYRVSAGVLVQALDEILGHEDDRYWFTGQRRDGLHLEIYTPAAASDKASSHLSPRLNLPPIPLAERPRPPLPSPVPPVSQLYVPRKNQIVCMLVTDGHLVLTNCSRFKMYEQSPNGTSN
jgi:serine/threonine protein kinase